MWRVTSGRPRIIRSQTAASPFHTQSADPILDKSKVWSGKPIELISIPNQTDEVAYFHIEIAGLQNTEYEINVFQSPLGDPYDLSFPRDFNANSSQREAEYLRRYYIQRNAPSGAMVTVPPHERLNVSITLIGERNAPYGFDVLLSQHLGPDRESAVTDDNNLDWHFEWLPRPRTGQVTLRLQPDRVLFRPWNITPHNRWFFLKWRLGSWDLFNKPSCLVIIENTNTLHLAVSPYLIGWQDNLPNATKRIPMNDVQIGPNEEIEVPCDLELSNKRDIEKLVVQAFAQVRIPGDNQPFEVESPEKITADWAPYLSKFKDIVALITMAICTILFLIWLIPGIPVPAFPMDVAVPISLNDKTVTDKQIMASQVTFQPLNEAGAPIIGQDIHSYKVVWNGINKQFELVFRLGGTFLFNRMPFGWTSPHERGYQITVIPKGDLEKRFLPLQAQRVEIELSPPNRPLFGPFTPTAKTPISLMPVYGANLQLTFSLPLAAHATKIKLVLTVTNKDPITRTIVINKDQRTYNENVDSLIGEGETSAVAIDATTEPGGYIASANAPDVTRRMSATAVTIKDFTLPDRGQTVNGDNGNGGNGAVPNGGAPNGGSGSAPNGGSLNGANGSSPNGGNGNGLNGGMNGANGSGLNGGNGNGGHGVNGNGGSHNANGGNGNGGNGGGNNGGTENTPGHEISGYQNLLNNDEQGAMSAAAGKTDAGALAVRSISSLKFAEKQIPKPDNAVTTAQDLIDRAKGGLASPDKGHEAALVLTAQAYLEFVQAQDDPGGDAGLTNFDLARKDSDSAIAAAPDLAYPYIVKITMLLTSDTGSATNEAQDTLASALGKVKNFRKLLKKFRVQMNMSQAGRDFVQQHKL